MIFRQIQFERRLLAIIARQGHKAVGRRRPDNAGCQQIEKRRPVWAVLNALSAHLRSDKASYTLTKIFRPYSQRSVGHLMDPEEV